MHTSILLLAGTIMLGGLAGCASGGTFDQGSTGSAYPGTSNFDPGKYGTQYGLNTMQPSEAARRSPASYGGGAVGTIQ